ncbi:hypothetical protein LARV_02675 [Longilinea arvoryzae]|uniref:Uncharacterized protein n=1 Tax=Longilinea arvoryzae TaxID=360412 RepID=A0A0S7BIA7_9CHLR|nr:hypothetical protein LARV_02675 [Longilinea arvoryzae]
MKRALLAIAIGTCVLLALVFILLVLLLAATGV